MCAGKKFFWLLLTATYVPSVTLYYYLLPSMSGCLHPRAPTTYPDRHRLRRRIWNIEGKTGFINPKNQVHKNVINWKIFGFQVIIFCCSFFMREINVSVFLHPYLSIARESGRQELNFSPHHLPDNWPHGKQSLWCWCWIIFCLHSK